MKRFITTLGLFLFLFSTAFSAYAQDTQNTESQDIEAMALAVSEDAPDTVADMQTQAELSKEPEVQSMAESLANQLKQEIDIKNEESEVLAEQHYKSGLQYYKKGYYKKALEEFNIVRNLVGEYRHNSKYLNKAQAKHKRFTTVKENRDMTNKKLENTRDLFLKAELLYKSGYHEQAYDFFVKVIEIDPSNILARRYMNDILEKRNVVAERDREISYKKRILDVEQAWFTDDSNIVLEGEEEEKEDTLSSEDKSIQQIMLEKKASQIIPEINFTSANLRDVVNYLSKISGVNIILDENALLSLTQPAADADTGDSMEDEYLDMDEDVEDESIGEEAMEEESAPVVTDKVTISLTNVPLLEALRYILAEKGLKYRIDEYAILISTPARLVEVEMQTRYYKLSSGIGGYTEFETIKGDIEEGTGDEMAVKEQTTIVDVIEQSGVPFPAGSKIFLDNRTGILIVKNTLSNLAIIEDIIKTLDVTPFQVQIEAKFVQVTESNLTELGLDWTFAGRDVSRSSKYGNLGSSKTIQYGGNITKGIRWQEDLSGTSIGDIFSISGILSNPEYQLVLHALQRTTNSDVLSAPKVTTVNNQQATIKVVDEIRYPEEYEVTQPTFNEQGTVTTPAVVTPGDFKTREVGIILAVTPSVGADRKTVTMTLIPEVSELLRWENFGMSFAQADGVSMDMPIRQPVFSTSTVSTTIIVNDGETVVLGGLIKNDIETFKDKVPILGDLPFIGRAFRNRHDDTVKKNLLIFVTANLLTPSGQKLKPEALQV